jgi:putative tryptophan/tyrosine transport system substrate-binding protein
MRRRDFVRVFGGAVAAWPVAARAQQKSKAKPLIGALWLGEPSAKITLSLKNSFARGLAEEGYTEGNNIAVEHRYYFDGLAKAANDLVALAPDVILVVGTPGILALKRATTSIPIVGVNMADPVYDGIVASLARPSGNVTGNTFIGPLQGSKRLELLRDLVPKINRVAGFRHPRDYSEKTMQDMLTEMQEAATKSGIEFEIFEAAEVNDFSSAFEKIVKTRHDALVVFPSPMFYVNYKPLVELPVSYQLPTMYVFKEAVEAGGLVSYGADIPDNVRLGVHYMARILKGASPRDLPVLQPTTYELVINLKTATGLGITPPPTFLALADEVIE